MPVLEGVEVDVGPGQPGLASFALAGNGSLVYVTEVSGGAERKLVWVDRQGNASTLTETLGDWEAPRFSPDGQRLAVTKQEVSNQDVWITSDGKTLVFRQGGDAGSPNLDIGMMDLEQEGEPEMLLETSFDEHTPKLSPQYRWLAYVSNSELRDATALPSPGAVSLHRVFAVFPLGEIGVVGGTEKADVGNAVVAASAVGNVVVVLEVIPLPHRLPFRSLNVQRPRSRAWTARLTAAGMCREVGLVSV